MISSSLALVVVRQDAAPLESIGGRDGRLGTVLNNLEDAACGAHGVTAPSTWHDRSLKQA